MNTNTPGFERAVALPRLVVIEAFTAEYLHIEY
jgi:hypothetical protein